MHRTLLAAALSLVTMVGSAQAARIATPPINPPLPGNSGDWEQFNCTIRYLGLLTTPQAVTVTAFSGTQQLGRRTFNMTRAAPVATLNGSCSDEFGIEKACRAMVCVWSVPSPTADFRGSVCIGEPGLLPICLGAY